MQRGPPLGNLGRALSGPYLSPGPRALSQRFLPRLEGRFVYDNSAFVQSETFQFLRTEAKDGGEAGSGSTLPLSNVRLSLVLNFCSSPSLRLRFSRGERLGFQMHLYLRMRMMVG